MADTVHVAHATAKIGGTPYAVSLSAGRHLLSADEPKALGGGDTGPAPFGLVLAGLGACTSITLTMYAERKGWPLQGVRVELDMRRDGELVWYERTIALEGDLTPDQRARLADVAERTPVTLALKGGAEIRTTLR